MMETSKMRYFTRSWALGELAEDEIERARQSYRRYIDCYAPTWPIGVAMLAHTSLHDGLPESAIVDKLNNTIRLNLITGDLATGYFRTSISYHGVDFAMVDLVTLRNVFCASSSELLYDEVASANYEQFAHSMLFYPDGELSITFMNLDIEKEPISRRTKRITECAYIEVAP